MIARYSLAKILKHGVSLTLLSQIERQTDRQTNERIDRGTDKRMNERTDKQTDGQMYRRTDVQK